MLCLAVGLPRTADGQEGRRGPWKSEQSTEGTGWGVKGAALTYWKKLQVDEGGNTFHVVSEFRSRAVCLGGYSQNLD